MLLNVDPEENEIGMSSKVYVKYHLAKTLRHPNIYEYIDDIIHAEETIKPNDTLIIVLKEEPNETLIKEINTIWAQSRIFVILYNINRLQFNPLKHKLVPPHRIMTETEDIEMRKKYNISNDN